MHLKLSDSSQLVRPSRRRWQEGLSLLDYSHPLGALPHPPFSQFVRLEEETSESKKKVRVSSVVLSKRRGGWIDNRIQLFQDKKVQ